MSHHLLNIDTGQYPFILLFDVLKEDEFIDAWSKDKTHEGFIKTPYGFCIDTFTQQGELDVNLYIGQQYQKLYKQQKHQAETSSRLTILWQEKLLTTGAIIGIEGPGWPENEHRIDIGKPGSKIISFVSIQEEFEGDDKDDSEYWLFIWDKTNVINTDTDTLGDNYD